MTRKEALDFLELAETASDYQVKQRLQDKLTYYENLSENAPSDFLRKLNAKHVVKVKTIQQEFPQWNPLRAEYSIEFPAEAEDIEMANAEEDAALLTTPIIISSGAKITPVLKKKIFPEPPGWLIRHTEGQPVKTFTLSPGKTYIGRRADAALNPFIVLDDDPFISKVHAVVFVEECNPVSFYIMDSSSGDGGKASRNGTYINGNEARITDKVRLQDNDAIQIGLTKLVLKLNNNNIQEIIQEVIKSKFMNTVVINQR